MGFHKGPTCSKLPVLPRTAMMMTKTKQSLGGATAIILLTIVAYIPVLRCGFIWDDDDHFTRNPAMNSVHGLERIWSSLAVSRYYPLTLTTFWVERRLWGLDPVPYHAVNVILQAANAVLLWRVLKRLRVRGAWLAAALWAVHPVGVESVAWVTELKNIQSGFFFFLSIWCFLRFEADNKRSLYAFTILFGAAAMLSKPSTVVLPLVLLLCAWWERGRWQRIDFLRAAPVFGLALAMSAMTVAEQQYEVQRASVAGWQLSPAERLVTAGKALWFYAGHVLWPANLMFVYPRWDVSAGLLASWLPLAGVIAIGAALWVYHRQPWARAAMFGAGYFVVALLPVMGFFNVYYFRYSFVADHFQYLATIGLIGLLVAGGVIICQQSGQWGRVLGIFGAAIALVVLGACTCRQTQVYRSQETLWEDTVTKNPDAYMARNNLGGILLQAGRMQEAIGQFEVAARLRPNDAEPYMDLGLALMRSGKVQEAVGRFGQALVNDPNFAPAHNGMGLALDKMGQSSQAARQYEEALRIAPNYLEALNNLAWLLATHAPRQGGNPARAVTLAEQASRLSDDNDANLLDTLGAAYAADGRFGDAISTAGKALELAASRAQTQLISRIEMRMKFYRSNRAYNEPEKTVNASAP